MGGSRQAKEGGGESKPKSAKLSAFRGRETAALEVEADTAADAAVFNAMAWSRPAGPPPPPPPDNGGGAPSRPAVQAKRDDDELLGVQRQVDGGGGAVSTVSNALSSLASGAAAVADAALSVAASPVIVADDAEPSEGQTTRSQFLPRLRSTVERAADAELARVGQTSEDCPYIEHWLGLARGFSVERLERGVTLLARPRERTVGGYLSAVDHMVRAYVREWVDSGRVELPPGADALTEELGEAPVQAKADGRGGDVRGSNMPRRILGQLGPGRSLPSTARSQMERGFGRSFADVRVHTDSRASEVVGQRGARALTVGQNVLFRHDQFRPDSLDGQVLLAHELAHTIQQRGGGRIGPTPTAAHEADADQAAAAAMGLPGSATPSMEAGLSVQGCGPELTPAEQAALIEEMRDNLEIRMTPDTGDEPAFAGTSVALQVHSTVTQGRFPIATSYEIHEPNRTHMRAPSSAGISRILLIDPGDWRIVAHVRVTPTEHVAIERSFRVVDRNTYTTELLDEFEAAYNRKQQLVSDASTTGEQLREIDERIEAARTRLQRMGVNMERQQLHETLRTGGHAAVTQFRTSLIAPSNISENERAELRLSVPYIPPGTVPEYRWSLRTGLGGRAVGGAHGPNLTLDESFWHAELQNIRAGGGSLEITGHVSLDGSSDTASDTRSYQVDANVPDQARITPALTEVLAGSAHTFRIAEFAPAPRIHPVTWRVDGHVVQRDQPTLHHRFSDVGTTTITATVHHRTSRWATEHPELFTTQALSVQVSSAQDQANAALDQQVDVPALGTLAAANREQMQQVEGQESLGGPAAVYWRSRAQALRQRQADLQRHIPDQTGVQELPAEEGDTFDTSQAYSGHVPAVLIVPRGRGVQPLSIYVHTWHDGTNWRSRVLDTTGEVQIYDGEPNSDARLAMESAFRDWDSDNPYPLFGEVHYRIGVPGWSLPKHFTTTTVGRAFQAWVDGVLLVGGIIVAGIMLLIPEPSGLTKAIAVAILAAGVIRSGVQIAQNIDRGMRWNDERNILEGLSMVAALAGVTGSALRGTALRAMTQPMRYRVGNWLVLSSVAGDAGALVYLTESAYADLQAARANPAPNEEAQAEAALRLATTFLTQGVMFIAGNRDMFTSGLRGSDFFPTDPHATTRLAGGGEVRLDPGQRIDIGAELRSAGDLPGNLNADVSDRVVVDRMRALGWLRGADGPSPQRISSMLQGLGTPALTGMSDLPPGAAGRLHEHLGNDVLNTHAPVSGGRRLNTLFEGLTREQFDGILAAFEPAGVRDLIDGVTPQRIRHLLGAWTPETLRNRVDELGHQPLRNLAADLTGTEIDALVARHGRDGVAWAAEHLPGGHAAGLLATLTPQALPAMMDVPAPVAARLLAELGPARVNTALSHGAGGPVSGATLQAMHTNFHEATVTNFLDWAGNAQNRLNRIARVGAHVGPGTAAVGVGGAMGARSVIMDNQARAAIDQLLAGDAYATLHPPLQRAIVALRRQAGIVPPAYADPPAGAPDLAHIVGPDTELRVTDAVAAETSASPFGPNSPALAASSRIDTDRTHADYRNVVTELEGNVAAGESVGGPEGAMDRSIIADAIFADVDPGTTPTLVSSDTRMVARLAERFAVAPGPFAPVAGGGGNQAQLMAAYPGGWFEAVIAGHRLRVYFQ